MDAIREQLGQKWVLAGLALVLGIVLGLGYGWGIDPVDWKDASPSLLRQDLQVDYLRMAIDSYSVNKNADLAVTRYERLGEAGPEVLRLVGESPDEVDPTAIQNFSAVVEIMDEPSQQPVEASPVVGAGQATEIGPTATESAPAGSSTMRLIAPVCGATLLLGALLIGALYLRNRLGVDVEDEPFLEPGFDMPDEYSSELQDRLASEFGEPPMSEPEPPAKQIETAVMDAEPLSTFRTIYALGDDRYDDSFSVESASGDFLGECGVGIGEIMGAGEPKKVSAFEVWLFDKNDIQTVTKVLMSDYTYKDEETRNRMAAKGDPVLAEPGGVVYLQTASLQVEARIVDMTYGQSALPDGSFFERMTIELRAAARPE
jgi:hypothetical protein